MPSIIIFVLQIYLREFNTANKTKHSDSLTLARCWRRLISAMRKLSIITLGVSNLERSIQFYENALDLKRDEFESNEIAFFDLDGPQLALFPKDELAKDVGVSPEGSGFQGITLAHNVTTSQAVTELLQRAVDAGGTLVKPGQPVFWGGFSGYFSDPDGYLWEIACGSEEYAKEKEHA